jgi:hypothetical protein
MNMVSVSRLLVSLVCLSTTTLSFAQQAEMPASTSFKVGDVWEWRQIDNFTKLESAKYSRTVVEVDGAAQFSNGTVNFPISKELVDGGRLNKTSAKPWRVWPLEVGKKWVYDAEWVNGSGNSGSTKQDVEVVAYEEVTLPTGKFMAYKIEHKGFYRNYTGGSGRQNDTFWYAPDVAADVKHMREDAYNRYTRELVSFKRATP